MRDGGRDRWRLHVETGADGVVTLRCTAASPPPPPPTGKVVLNEVDYDQVGSDGGGFVELFNAGAGVVSLDGLAVVAVNGGDTSEYERVLLSGTLAPGGYRVVDIELQNGAPDAVAIVDTVTADLVDALSYEGAINAAMIGGTPYDLVEGTALPPSIADSNTVDGSLARIPNGVDTDDAASDWTFTTTATRGAANVKS